MANSRNTYQQTTNVSINKNKLIEIATNYGLNETDLRVLFVLFTELNGWSRPPRAVEYARAGQDPMNYKILDKEKIAETLDLKKKQVKKAINNLIDAGLVEPGSSDAVQDGYRFTF